MFLIIEIITSRSSNMKFIFLDISYQYFHSDHEIDHISRQMTPQIGKYFIENYFWPLLSGSLIEFLVVDLGENKTILAS